MTYNLTENQKSQYEKFYEKLGDKQMLKPIEEMSELTTEIIQYYTKRTPENLEKLTDELGDVYNALDSLVYGLGLDVNDINDLNDKRLEKLSKVQL